MVGIVNFVDNFLFITGSIDRMTFFVRTMALLGMYIVCFLILAFISAYFLLLPSDTIGKISLYSMSAIFIYSLIALSIKRLHDMGQYPWLSLLLLIPYLNIFVYIFFLLNRGNGRKNEMWKLS